MNFNRVISLLLKRPILSLALFLIFLTAMVAVGVNAPSRLSDAPGDDFADYAAETWVTLDTLLESSPTTGTLALAAVDLPDGSIWPDAQARARVDEVKREFAKIDELGTITGPNELPEAFVAQDQRSILLALSFTSDSDPKDYSEQLHQLFADDDTVAVGGAALVMRDINEQVSADLAKAEMIAIPLLILVSILVFRSLIAGFLPVIVGCATVFTTFSSLILFDLAKPMSIFAVNLVFALGLGLAVDYSLLLLTRLREARAAGYDKHRAVIVATTSIAPTISFSALTVAAALASLTLFPQRFLWSMGVGGIICALMSAIISLTLLPVVLGVLGDRIDWLQPKRWRRSLELEHSDSPNGRWARIARFVMRRPGTIAILTSLFLIAGSFPALDVKFTGVDTTSLPTHSASRQATELINERFPAAGGSQLTVIAKGENPAQLDAGLQSALSKLGDRERAAIAAPLQAHRSGDELLVAEIPLVAHPTDDAAQDFTKDLRRELRSLDGIDLVGVTGASTITIDTLDSFGRHLPAAIAMIVTTTLILVFLFTGSVLLPIKAVIMNVLTIGIAIGTLVLVFQDGRFEDVLGYVSQGGLESSQPILIAAVAFGLSTDYGIILLGRIREERIRGRSEREAVAMGLQHTGRVVTSAALLLSIALGAFILSELIFIKQIGVGTVVAVIVDATIVRALLVPSLMALLGKWNWWAPRPLRRFHDRFGLSEPELPEPPSANRE